MLQPDTLLNGRYRLLEPVGEGGMAVVYRAVDNRLGRTVAIKVLRPQFAQDQPFLQRFQQEAEFAASLGAHPNIVDIYDIGQDGDYHYIVMEFVEGRSLKDLIEERAPFSVQETFAIGSQVASALDFAHKRGLIHRDVKPQNIMVEPDGTAKVTDFGIARSLSASQLTRTGMVIGTVHYFSPEQAQGKPAGPASDIYSLGIILYEMLTGHLPFDAETPIGVAMQHLHSQPPSPWDYNPDLPARAVATALRALEKDPEQRYRDAAEFASALGSGAAAAAPPPEIGRTTISPIVEEPPPARHTAVYQATPPEPVRRRETVVEEARPAAQTAVPRNSMRTMWLALAGALLAVVVGLGAFFFTSNVLGGGHTPTATPTATPRPTPTPHKRKPTPTLTPTVAVPVFVPTLTSTPLPLPTFTPTAIPPTATPKPKPRPTATPSPPTPTPTPVLPTPTPTTAQPTATPTPSG